MQKQKDHALTVGLYTRISIYPELWHLPEYMEVIHEYNVGNETKINR